MIVYDRSEFGWPVVVTIAVVLVILAVIEWNVGLTTFAVVEALVLAMAAAMFSTLRTRVVGAVPGRDAKLEWSFLLGFPRGSVALDDIEAVESATTTLADGIGIHITGRGWVWNVHNGNAVWVHRKNRGPIVIGTSDPQGLCAAIEQARSGRV